MTDTWDKISKRMTALSELTKRMDNTSSMLFDEYSLKNFKGDKMSNVISVTGNRPKKFGVTVVSDLLDIKWQTVIEGSLSQKQSHAIEQFIEDNLDQADEYILQKYGIVGLYDFLCNHVCVRGPIGAEWVARIENGEYKIHCLPCDMRWTPPAYGKDGLDWVAPITFRSKEELEAEFPEQKGKVSGKEIEVRDYWDSEKNELWIDKRMIYQREHPFGKPPFVIVFPPAGFMLRDKGYMKREGEDLFWLVRELNDEWNRSLSIEQSLVFNVLNPPYEYEVEVDDASPDKPPPKTGQTLKVKKGERHIPVPTGDYNRANMVAHTDMQRMIEEVTPTAPRMYTQPPSGAELLAELEIIQKLQNPRVIALRVFKEQLARLMIDQYIAVNKDGGSFNIGKRGKRREYSPALLRDPETYTISYQSKSQNKRLELANLAMYIAAYDRLPIEYNLTHILQVDDPAGVLRMLEVAKAERAEPAIGLIKMGLRLIDEADEIEDEAEANAKYLEAKLLAKRIVAILKPQVAPQQPESQKEPGPGNAGALMPLLGPGGIVRGGSNREQEVSVG